MRRRRRHAARSSAASVGVIVAAAAALLLVGSALASSSSSDSSRTSGSNGPVLNLASRALLDSSPSSLYDAFVEEEEGAGHADDVGDGTAHTPEVTSFHPTSGNELGGTKIVISGTGFVDDLQLSCHFGDEDVVPATFISSTELYCLSPPARRPGEVEFWISSSSSSLGEKTEMMETSVYQYTFVATVFAIEPPFGPPGTTISIKGSGYLNTTSLICRFDTVVVPATFISDTRLDCVSPPDAGMPIGHAAVMSVSNNGVDVEGDWSGVTYTFAPSPMVVGVDPITVPIAGGTVLSIYGENFISSNHPDVAAFCRLDGVDAPAIVLSENEMQCTTPVISLEDEEVSSVETAVEVSIDDGMNFASDGSVVVTLHDPPAIESVFPPHAPETGGSELTVTGRNFHPSDKLECIFGDRGVMAATWRSHQEITCKTLAGPMSSVDLMVSTNGQDSGMAVNTIPFTFTNVPTVASLRPSWGSVKGGTIVAVMGKGFDYEDGFRCRFGSIVVNAAEVVNSTMAMCEAPPLLELSDGPVVVEVSTNYGYDFSFSNKMYSYRVLPKVASLSPDRGYADALTNIEIVGVEFSALEDDALILCRFSETSSGAAVDTVAAVVSDELLTCSTPHLSDLGVKIGDHALTHLDVTIDGVELEWSDARLNVTLFPPPSLLELKPSFGSELGGTSITVKGSGFVTSDNITCKFGDELGPSAEWISGQTILCITPEARRDYGFEADINVTLSFDGGSSFMPSSLMFSYKTASSIHRITPTFGPRSGGTLIHITGVGFIADSKHDALCLFGENQVGVKATVISSSLATCHSPPLEMIDGSDNVVGVTLTFNDGHDASLSNVAFSFVDDPIVSELSPTFASCSGGSLVTMVGKNFAPFDHDKVWVAVGDVVVDATVLSDTDITFTMPSMPVERSDFPVRLSLNGVDFTDDGPILSLYPDPKIERLSPPFAYECGGATITVAGSGFTPPPGSSTQCIFSLGGVNMLSDALVLNDSIIKCIAPSSRAGFGPSKLAVKPSHLSDTPLSSVSFEYRQASIIRSITPDLGTVDGGTEISVKGVGFHDSLLCVFLNPSSMQVYDAVVANFYDEQHLSCTAPAYTSPGQLLLSLGTRFDHELREICPSGNGSNHRFSYYEPFSLHDIDPSAGPMSGGGTMDIRGEGFVNSTALSCFFSFDGDEAHRVKGVFHTSNRITCSVPAHPASSTKNAILPAKIRLSLNGVEVSDQSLDYAYHPPMSILSVYPSTASSVGGVELAVSTLNSTSHQSLRCIFKATDKGSKVQLKQSPAVYYSSSSVGCTLPALPPGLYSLELSSCIQDFEAISSSSVLVSIHPTVAATRLSPAVGYASGGTIVTLSGEGFSNTSHLACRFGGNSIVTATYLSKIDITCTAPPYHTHPSAGVKVAVEMSLNGIEFFNPRDLAFTYVPSPSLSELSPALGHLNGATEVAIVGANLLPQDSIKATIVRFGDVAVEAVSMNDTVVIVTSPPQANEGPYPVSINTIGGTEYVSSGLSFAYVQLPVIRSIHPSSGLEAGGDSISVEGSSFLPHPNATCRFGDKQSKAIVTSSQGMECVAPRSEHPGPVVFAVTLNGMDWTDNRFTYNYLPKPVVNNLAIIPAENEIASDSLTDGMQPSIFKASPTKFRFDPSTGDINGNTTVRIEALDAGVWLDSDLLQCRFGSQSVDVKLISPRLLECTSPQKPFATGSVALSVTANGIDFVEVGTFKFVPRPSVLSVYPSAAVLADGVTLSLSGLGFDPTSSEATCKLVSIDNRVQNSTLEVKATIESPEIASCAILGSLPPSTYRVLLSNSGRHEYGSSTTVFSSLGRAQIEDVYPLSGVIGLTTTVEISGNGFGLEPKCALFSSDLMVASSGARVANTSHIECDISCPGGNNSIEERLVFKISTDGGSSFVSHERPHWCDPVPVVKAVSPDIVAITSNALYNPRISVMGTGFRRRAGLSCRFSSSSGLAVVAASFEGSEQVSCELPPLNMRDIGSNITVEVSNNGRAFDENAARARIQVVSPPRITAVEGKNVFAGGPLLLQGSNFVTGMTCRLGGTIARSVEVESKTKATCYLPSDAEPQDLALVQLSLDGATFSAPDKAARVNVRSRPRIFALSPSSGMVTGSATIRVNGEHLDALDNPTCHFGSNTTSSTGIIVSDTVIVCATPPSSTAGSISFSVSGNGFATMEPLNYTYIEPITIRDFSPTSGPLQGGTNVLIRAHSFDPTVAIACAFGSADPVEATVLSPTTAACVTPSLPRPDIVSFSLLHTASRAVVAVTAIPTRFVFYSEAAILRIDPVAGPIKGGTRVKVYGSWHVGNVGNKRMACRFGSTVVDAVLSNADEILCESPPSSDATPGSTVELTISQNGDDFSPDSVPFTYHKDVTVQDLSLARGPQTGGTTVALTGENLDLASGCIFGDIDAYSYHDRALETLYCVAPKSDEPKRVEIRLRTVQANISTGKQYVYGEQLTIDKPTPLKRDVPFTVRTMSPIHGPSSGGTNISIAGAGFRPNATILCVFGDSAMLAEYHSDTKISCLSSPTYLDEDAKVSTVALTVLQDSHSETALNFTYYATFAPSAISFYPTAIDAQGGAFVQMDGFDLDKILDFSESNGIRVDPIVKLGSAEVQAQRANEGGVSFIAPAFDHLEAVTPVDVHLSLNGGLDFISCGTFQVYPSPKILAIDPSAIQLGQDDDIQVLGLNFVAFEEARCRFGSITKSATILSDTLMACALPDEIVSGEIVPGLLPVTIALNGRDYTEDVLPLIVNSGITVTSTNSSYISERGGTNVILEGTNLHLLRNHGSISLVHAGEDSRMSKGILPHSVSNTSCEFTASPGQGEVAIHVGFDGAALIDTGFSLQYLPAMIIKGLNPPYGAVEGGYPIEVFGDFSSDLEYECEIQSADQSVAVVSALAADTNTLRCVMPPSKSSSGLSYINIRRLADNDASNRIAFVYTGGALVSLNPSIIPETGGMVLINGNNFEEQEGITCEVKGPHGESTSTPAVWISSEEVECSVPELPVGRASIHVISNGGSAASNWFPLSIAPAIRLLNFSPQLGSVKGGTRLDIRGSGLDVYNDNNGTVAVICRFGDQASKLTVLNSTFGICASPPSQDGEGQASFTLARHIVSKSGRIIVENAENTATHYFRYRDPPVAVSVDPLEVSTGGGSIVKIDTNGALSPEDSVTVRLVSRTNSSLTNMADFVKVLDDGDLTLELPPSMDGSGGGVASIELSLNGQDFSEGGATLTYVEALWISSIFPSVIPAQSSFSIIIHGENFGEISHDLSCRVGISTYPAEWASPTLAICTISDELEAGLYSVGLSSNGRDFAVSPTRLRIRPVLQIKQALSLAGPMRGNTLVTIEGDGFITSADESLLCSFGGETVKANTLNNTHLTCLSPPQESSGLLPLRLAIDRGMYDDFFGDPRDNFTSDILDINLMFEYYEDEGIASISPSIGPASGGTLLDIVGSGFLDLPTLTCKVGLAEVGAVYKSSENVQCTVPPAETAFGSEHAFLSSVGDGGVAATKVQVSNNGVDFDTGATFHATSTFSYYPDPILKSIYPEAGPPSGGMDIIIKGRGFVETDGVVCELGSEIVPAIVSMSTQSVVCETPPHAVGSTIQVKISFNAQDFSADSLTFNYIDAPILYQVLPPYGPSRGQNLVTIFGANFEPSELYFRFGPVTVQATASTGKEATVIAPPNDAGVVELHLINMHRDNFSTDIIEIEDKDDSTDHALTYQYLDEAFITDLTPSKGPSHGGTKVELRGHGFPVISDLLCKFGEGLSHATWVSAAEVFCIVPPGANDTVTVNVGFLDAGGAFVSLSQSSVLYTYYDPPHFSGIYPLRGLLSGGIRVTITVENMPTDTDETIKCRFNDTEVIGKLHSDASISCEAPSQDVASLSEVKVSLNDHDYHSAGHFNYHEAMVVLSATPSHGSVSGGTVVDISGVGFPEPHDANGTISCNFGAKNVAAEYIDSTLVRCTAPAHIESSVVVNVVYFSDMSGAQMRSESNATFDFVPEVPLDYTFPAILPALSADSGHLEVFGSNFMQQDTLACKFDVSIPSNATSPLHRNHIVETAATFRGPDSIECGPGVPGLESFFTDEEYYMANDAKILGGASASLSVTTNGQEWAEPIHLTFAADPIVTSIYPALGSITGGTSVIVRGKHFLPTDTLACAFGELPHDANGSISYGDFEEKAVGAIEKPSVRKVDVSVLTSVYRLWENSL